MKRSTVVEEWRAEARAEGEAKGEAKGRIASVIELLEARFGAVPADLADKIKSTTDVDTLRAWNLLAAKADSLSAFRTQSGL